TGHPQTRAQGPGSVGDRTPDPRVRTHNPEENPMTATPRIANCRVCATPIGWIDNPSGGWWAHRQHPADGHDAVPGAWEDGDPLMEAIAAAVWEHCNAQGTSVVADDPRNLAVASAEERRGGNESRCRL